MMTIVVDAEEKFGVADPRRRVKNLSTVGDAVSYIEKARADPRSSTVHGPTWPAIARNDTSDDRPPRVVVTGLGATTPLGGDVASTWAACWPAGPGSRSLTEDWVEHAAGAASLPGGGRPVRGAGRVAGPAARPVRPVRARRRPGGLGGRRRRRRGIDRERLGVVVATGIGGVTTLLAPTTCSRRRAPAGSADDRADADAERPGRAGRASTSAPAPGCTPRSAPAPPAPRRSRYGVDMIRSGRADVVVAGGTEAAIHPLPMAGFAAMQALSTRNDEPERASRPYDKGRDGFVLGEGAGVAGARGAEHAAARGATHLRRDRRRRHHLRRPPHGAAATRSGAARPGPCRWRSQRRRADRRRRRAHQRARHLHPGRRHRRGAAPSANALGDAADGVRHRPPSR